MSEHSIEVLGQKFSYPSTWHGTVSILIVCASISFIAYALEPEQINSYGGWFGSESDKKIEEGLVDLNKKQSEQIVTLKAEVSRLTTIANLAEDDKNKITTKLEAADKEINDAYNNLIGKQTERKDKLNTIINSSGQQQRQILNIEQGRISQQIKQFQQQQEQLDYR